MKSGKWELIDLYPGCHIRCQVNNFYHHGIYIGDGKVIQFGLPFDVYKSDINPEEISVVESSLSEFSPKSKFIEVYSYSKAEARKKFSDTEIIERAKSLLGTKGYDVLNNNCEHFANFCIFGEKKSYQIDKIYENVSKMMKK